MSRDLALNDMDDFIKAQLIKDPKLPRLDLVDKQNVMVALRKSDKFKNDIDAVRSLKAVLSMREKLAGNQPGKVINGRKLVKPVPLKIERSALSIASPTGLVANEYKSSDQLFLRDQQSIADTQS